MGNPGWVNWVGDGGEGGWEEGQAESEETSVSMRGLPSPV